MTRKKRILKYTLFAIGENIIFVPLWHSELIHATGAFTAKNGWRVLSESYPEIQLGAKKIYLPGKREDFDNKLASAISVKPEKVIDEINTALREFADFVRAESRPKKKRALEIQLDGVTVFGV